MQFNRRELSLIWAALNSKAAASAAASQEKHLSEDQRVIQKHLAREYSRLCEIVMSEHASKHTDKRPAEIFPGTNDALDRLVNDTGFELQDNGD